MTAGKPVHEGIDSKAGWVSVP